MSAARHSVPPLLERRPSAWLDSLRHVVKPPPGDGAREARVEARRFAEQPVRHTAMGDL